MSDFGLPPAALPERVVLDGWKEIAFHFGVTARTVQMWEAERGLPVYRKPGPKGRVYAYTDELQAWNLVHSQSGLESIPADESSAEEADEPSDSRVEALPPQVAGSALDAVGAGRSLSLPRRLLPRIQAWPVRTWLAVCAALLVVASGGAWVVRQQARKALVSVDVSEWSLRGFDDQGRVLWTHRWKHPWHQAYATLDHPPRPLVADLDENGENEVYVWHESLLVEHGAAPNAVLYSFDGAGNIRWKFEPDATLRTSYREFPPPYSGRAVRAVRYDGGRKQGILAVANHHMNYPSRVLLFSAEGLLLREYLHSGHLHSFLVDDFDQDGREEICMAGIANDYEAADLVVLDPDTMHGASAEPRRQLLGVKGGPVVASGTERRRLILPRTYLSKRVDPFGMPGILQREGDLLLVSTAEGPVHLKSSAAIHFAFDRQLRLVSTGVSENYQQSWEMLRDQGKLDRAFRPSDLDVLKDVRDVTGGRDFRATE